jgi:flagellin
MSAVINTNILSLNAQRNLQTSQNQLATALQRLSSGLRINSAKDDAAGLAIATRFTTQINGLDQAVRNANDGVSLAQTAESALSEVTNNLQRIRQLAVESANATNSASDRAALDQEVQQRIAEISRIASQTTFNGLRVLDGSFGQKNFQVGADVGDIIGINLSQGVRADQIGSIAVAQGSDVNGTGLSAGDLTIAIGDGQAVAIGASASGSAKDVADAISAANISGLTVSASNSHQFGLVDVSGGAAGDTYSLTINGTEIFSNQDASSTLTAQAIASAINAQSAATGVTASYDSANGKVVLANADGSDITVNQAFSAGASATGGLDSAKFANGTDVAVHGAVSLTADAGITVGGATPANAGLAAQTYAVDTSKQLQDANVLTVAGANKAIQRIDAALTSVSTLRSSLGAIQNRFDSTVANLQAISQNLSSARSRVQDADFAKETAALSKAQILQQAGVSVLAQANAAPQTVLKLLR